MLLQQGVPSVPALLERYADYGGLVLHWRVYGTGPHILRPDGGVLASYTVCCAKHARERYHRQIKSFVQPARTLYPEVGWVVRGEGGVVVARADRTLAVSPCRPPTAALPPPPPMQTAVSAVGAAAVRRGGLGAAARLKAEGLLRRVAACTRGQGQVRCACC